MNNSINFNSFVDLYVEGYKQVAEAPGNRTPSAPQVLMSPPPKHLPFVPAKRCIEQEKQERLAVKQFCYSFIQD